MAVKDFRKEYHLKGGDEACLLIHGITSTPGELRELGERLNQQGYTVSGVRMKGHGTTIEELEKCTWKDWVDSAITEFEKLRKTCSKVNVIGHSMGSMVSLHIAENHDVNRIVAMSPPLVSTNKMLRYVGIIKYFRRYNNWIPKTYTPDQKKYMVGYYKVPIRSLHEMNKLIADVRKNLQKINQPILIINSLSDRAISPVGIEILMSQVSSETKDSLILQHCGHNITIENEKEDVFASIISFLKK